MTKVYSNKFSGLLIWEGTLPLNRGIDIDKTDVNVETYMDSKLFQWEENNPLKDEDWAEVQKHEIWLELNEELFKENNQIISWTSRRDFEIQALIHSAGLENSLNYEIVELEGIIDVKLFSKERYVCLPYDLAENVLEDCAMSQNTEAYLWTLADRAVTESKNPF